ncbi:MAG TPA: FHA domain-containing protein [Solirubrobacteraceae bacterium]|nr:FHA domain-containing protein [Solirubrobacteraceae bacterium]
MESLLGLGTPTQEEMDARREAERGGEPFLIYRDEEGRQLLHVLGSERRSVTLGRRHEADVSVPWDPEMSRLHAELELHAGEWTICDDGFSQNGTWVNGLRLVGRRRLLDGDLLRVGRTMFAFCAPATEGLRPTLVPGELSGAPRFSEQQQRVLRALCRPLFSDGEGVQPATDEEVAAETGVALEDVEAELDHLARMFGLEDMPPREQRAEVALLALRSGLVSGG